MRPRRWQAGAGAAFDVAHRRVTVTVAFLLRFRFFLDLPHAAPFILVKRVRDDDENGSGNGALSGEATMAATERVRPLRRYCSSASAAAAWSPSRMWSCAG
ncbi:hypothetical protein ZWY2020_025726 [Hordeum vulgare]|nr:hypothetical protein ZWY2020_025726 [Hordeum vulgare]